MTVKQDAALPGRSGSKQAGDRLVIRAKHREIVV
jgi:hypothetical protein